MDTPKPTIQELVAQEKAKLNIASNKSTEETPIDKPLSSVIQELDWNLPSQKIKQLQDFLRTYEGKHGHNPFIYYNQQIQPLVLRFHKGDRSVELFNLIMSLPLEAPTVDKIPQPISAIIYSTGLPIVDLWKK